MEDYLITEFLKDVEKKLPSWLKENKKETQEILDELEEHIWDKAEELAENPQPSINHIREAIKSMGSPDSITKEYKKRGTPFIYITKEWIDIYKKILFIVFSAIAGISFLFYILSIATSAFDNTFLETISGIWTASIQAGVVVTAIFVFLSMDGYLPKDFDGMKCKVMEEIKTDENKKSHKKRKEKIKAPLNTKKYLSEGIWGILWALLFIIQPIESINQYFNVDFLIFIRYSGTISLLISLIKLSQVSVGIQRVGLQQLLIFVTLIINLLYVPLILYFLEIPGVLSIFSENISFTFPFIIFKIVFYLWLFGIAVETIENLAKMGMYQNKLNKYNEYQKLFN